MIETQQKTKQYKNIAVAIVKDEDGKILLVKSTAPAEKNGREQEWDFPANVIIPGATYTETFASDVLEKTGCIVEATALISSEKIHAMELHYEYVECKIVCREDTYKKSNRKHKWVPTQKLTAYFASKFNKDLSQFFDL